MYTETTLIFLSIEIRSILHRNDADIWLINITSNRARRNDVDLLLIKITSKKASQKTLFFVSRNYIKQSTSKQRHFLPIEIISRKYVKITWKFINIFFLTYRRNIDIESTSIRHGVSVELW